MQLKLADLTVVFALALSGAAEAQSVATQRKALTWNARFCHSWAEAHERTLASLNNGRPPYPVNWKGCLWLKKGAPVDVVHSGDEGTEIILRGKSWFADDPLF